jgi:hypothetical protein
LGSKPLYSISVLHVLMDYSFKRGFKPDMERIQKALEEEFPVEIKQEKGSLTLGFGALKSINVSINGKKLNVTTESELGVSDEVALDTNKRFRNFLEKATGYNAKQRMQMAKKEATKGAE